MTGNNCDALYKSLATEKVLNAQLKAVEAILKRYSLSFSLEVFRSEVTTRTNTMRKRVQIDATILPLYRSALHNTIAAETNYDTVKQFGYTRPVVERDGNDSDTSVVPELNDESYGYARGLFQFIIHNRSDTTTRCHLYEDGCTGRIISEKLRNGGALEQLIQNMEVFLRSAHSFYMRHWLI